MTRVLVVATSRKTRGGITSVVKAHETGEQWKRFHCRWIQSHRDGPALRKIWYLASAIFEYLCLLPFYDIVHIHIATTQSAKRKRLFFYPAKWLGKKTIFHFHPSNEKFLLEPYNQKLYHSLFSKADLTIVLSPQWKRWLNESLGLQENIRVLFNPCPQVNRNENSKKPIILFAGTIIPRKGYETLLRGFSLIAGKYPQWKIIFAGNGEIDKAQSIATKFGIEKQVEFKGWISGKKKETAICPERWGDTFGKDFYDFSLENNIYYSNEKSDWNSRAECKCIEEQPGVRIMSSLELRECAMKLRLQTEQCE